MSHSQPWIHSARVDGAFILAPGLLAAAIALWLMRSGFGATDVSAWMWLLLVVGIDVAHVYSTIYRTYFDKQERVKLSVWLWTVPLLAWIAGMICYSISPRLFWSALAYTAVFHFIRQQYGFVMIYSRQDRALPALNKRINQTAIYAATLGPMLYWHTHLPRPFTWFVEGDFISLPMSFWKFGKWIYAAVLVAYLLKEIWLGWRHRQFNIPRNCMMLVTATSWYVGIIVAQGDLIFTLTNVVAHGIPYIALTFVYKKAEVARFNRVNSWFKLRRLPLTIGLLMLFAYIEEGLWDCFVWREHLQFFPLFSLLPQVSAATLLAIVVPLLTVPQLTHYVLDAVIWRLRDQPEWRTTLFWFSKGKA